MTESPSISLGAVGHRVLTDVPRIQAGVDQAVRRVQELNPDRELEVLSSLAEGADRLIAKAVLHRTASRLTAILPVEVTDYRADFTSPESVHEFDALLARASKVVVMPRGSSREESYEAAAQYVVTNCQVLIAIWDGEAPLGRGGTGDTVGLARQGRLAIAWVKAGNREPGTMNPTVDADQGTVIFENM